MDYDFQYLLEKIERSGFEEVPFRHIEINDFFSQDHFERITRSPEIKLEKATSSKELCDLLTSNGYAPIQFPGCTVSIDEYLDWEAGKQSFVNVDTCEGFGITFRLERSQSDIIEKLKAFLVSDPFSLALCRKFDIDLKMVFKDIGIQKYLNGYEISPHADIRKKALTFMVNINPLEKSETLDHHTHYLAFKDEKRYVQEFWRYNDNIDRAWVPWDWCRTVKQQTRNNSIVIFQPGHDTLHAVRAKYDHLETQRTQLYGNLWYGEEDAIHERTLSQIPWQGLLIDESAGSHHKMIGAATRKPHPVKRLVKSVIGR